MTPPEEAKAMLSPEMTPTWARTKGSPKPETKRTAVTKNPDSRPEDGEVDVEEKKSAPEEDEDAAALTRRRAMRLGKGETM